MIRQKEKPCRSCPWMRSTIFGDYFAPEVLEKTIVPDIDTKVQTCHHGHDTYCAGALAFQKRTDTMKVNDVLQRGIEWNLIRVSMIDATLETFLSVDAMIESHQERYDLFS